MIIVTILKQDTKKLEINYKKFIFYTVVDYFCKLFGKLKLRSPNMVPIEQVQQGFPNVSQGSRTYHMKNV